MANKDNSLGINQSSDRNVDRSCPFYIWFGSVVEYVDWTFTLILI